jgi:hypothetical protein
VRGLIEQGAGMAYAHKAMRGYVRRAKLGSGSATKLLDL